MKIGINLKQYDDKKIDLDVLEDRLSQDGFETTDKTDFYILLGKDNVLIKFFESGDYTYYELIGEKELKSSDLSRLMSRSIHLVKKLQEKGTLKMDYRNDIVSFMLMGNGKEENNMTFQVSVRTFAKEMFQKYRSTEFQNEYISSITVSQKHAI